MVDVFQQALEAQNRLRHSRLGGGYDGATPWQENFADAWMLDTLPGQAIQSIDTHMRGNFHQNYDPDYSALRDDDLGGYMDYLEEFVGSGSPGETAYLKEMIDINRKRREDLDRGGAGWSRFFANLANPVNLVPIPIAGGIGFVRGIKAGVAVGGTAIAAEELVRAGIDPTSTELESGLAIGTGAILGGVIGGAAGTIGARSMARWSGDVDTFWRANEASNRLNDADPEITAGIRPMNDPVVESVKDGEQPVEIVLETTETGHATGNSTVRVDEQKVEAAYEAAREGTPSEVIYHGTRIKPGEWSTFIDEQGNLVLIASENFDGKQYGVSLTPDRASAEGYAQRKSGRGAQVIFEIDKSKAGDLDTEAMNELFAAGRDVIIPAGSYRVRGRSRSANIPESAKEFGGRKDVTLEEFREHLIRAETAKAFFRKGASESDADYAARLADIAANRSEFEDYVSIAKSYHPDRLMPTGSGIEGIRFQQHPYLFLKNNLFDGFIGNAIARVADEFGGAPGVFMRGADRSDAGAQSVYVASKKFNKLAIDARKSMYDAYLRGQGKDPADVGQTMHSIKEMLTGRAKHYAEFKAEVTRAYLNGGQHADPHVREGAEAFKGYMDAMGEAAAEAGKACEE